MGPCEANPTSTPTPESECDPATTCTGKEKECKGDVCKCKSGFKEDPAIAEPEGTDDCVPADACRNGILLPKLFWPTVRKNCSSDWENFWNSKLKAERSLKQFVWTVKGQNSFWYYKMLFWLVPGGFSDIMN